MERFETAWRRAAKRKGGDKALLAHDGLLRHPTAAVLPGYIPAGN